MGYFHSGGGEKGQGSNNKSKTLSVVRIGRGDPDNEEEGDPDNEEEGDPDNEEEGDPETKKDTEPGDIEPRNTGEEVGG